MNIKTLVIPALHRREERLLGQRLPRWVPLPIRRRIEGNAWHRWFETVKFATQRATLGKIARQVALGVFNHKPRAGCSTTPTALAASVGIQAFLFGSIQIYPFRGLVSLAPSALETKGSLIINQ